MNGRYILKDRVPVPCEDLYAWAIAYENYADRVVAKDTIGGSDISTVFLGLDHNFNIKGPPVLFETMVFGGPLDQEQERYCTWAEAEAGHAAMCKRVSAANR